TVGEAVEGGLYGVWQPTPEEIERLEAIFPDGVCDFSQPGVGDPRTFAAPGQDGDGDGAGAADDDEGGYGDAGGEPAAALWALIAALVAAAVVGLSMLGGRGGEAGGAPPAAHH